ncbi:MAG: chloride channel protein [Kiritimatiellia bacterium]
MLKKARKRIDRTRRQLSRKSWKFFMAGDGMSVRMSRYFGESILVGVVTGFVVVGFRYMIALGREWITEGIGHHQGLSRLAEGVAFSRIDPATAFADPFRWVMLVLPALGALLGYLLIRRFDSLEHARGTGSAILAYHRRHGYVPPVVIPVKSTASVLTVASGGSAGYEGPVTLLGAACGSCVASWFGLSARARRILMTAGLSAGIAALFQAPLAGAIFGFEILYSSSDIEYECILPCFIASAVSYTIFAYFFGWAPLFTMPSDCVYQNGWRLFPYFGLAIVITFAARFYISLFRGTERFFDNWRIPGPVKVVLGGLVTGVIGFFFPDILGTSYDVIQACFAAGQSELYENVGPLSIAAFLSFFVLKAVATASTIGSGGSGGVFAPALVCGGAVGAAVGLVCRATLPAALDIHPAAFALVGMAGFLASANRIPIAAVVMVAEISGNHGLLLPAMWVCGISFWLNNDWTLYRSQVHNRESSPAHA